MGSAGGLKAFFESRAIPVILPSDPEYAAVNTYFQLTKPEKALALVRPRNAEEVATAVKYATANRIRIAVRTGGHDLFGRSQADGALTIDMRNIDFVQVDQSRSAARIGGGCLAHTISSHLSRHGLLAVLPAIPIIGFVGWATLGGYGPYMAHFGLGVDQIIGAKVVNWKGEVVNADRDMLKGILGAGGNFGIIVELTIKVYPVPTILGGMVMFEAADVPAAFDQYIRGWNQMLTQGVPPALGVQPIVANGPEGRQFGVLYNWSSSDLDEGQTWLEKVCALGTERMRVVKPMTGYEWMSMMKDLVSSVVYGYSTSVSISKVTPEIARVICRNVGKMPTNKSTMFCWHELREGPSTQRVGDDNNTASVFGTRQPHLVLEILGLVDNPDPFGQAEAEKWTTTFREELLQCGGVLPTNYVSVTRPDQTSLLALYGGQGNLDALFRLKDQFDPHGIFDLAVPRLRTRTRNHVEPGVTDAEKGTTTTGR